MTTRRLAVLWTVTIVALCLVPGSEIPEIDAPLSTDKWVHAAMFFGFGALWGSALPRRTWAVFGVGVVLGVAIEVAQHWLQWGRSGDPFDALADVAGLVLGIALARAIAARRSAT